MTTIKNVNEFTKKNGKKGWKFVLDDGTEGFITNDSPWEYKAGDQVSYTVADKGTYKLLTLTRIGEAPQAQETKPTSAPTKTIADAKLPQSESIGVKTIQEMKHEARIEVISVLGKLASEGKIEPKEIPEFFNEFYPVVDLSYDVIG